MVIVTSNAERQLPDAFLRRCVFFHIPFPDERALDRILSERFDRPESPANKALISDSIAIAKALRSPGLRLIKPPGTAELIGFVRALLEPGRDTDWENTEPLSKLGALARAEQALPWSKLPALHCLVKLKEDLDTLERLGAKV